MPATIINAPRVAERAANPTANTAGGARRVAGNNFPTATEIIANVKRAAGNKVRTDNAERARVEGGLAYNNRHALAQRLIQEHGNKAGKLTASEISRYDYPETHAALVQNEIGIQTGIDVGDALLEGADDSIAYTDAAREAFYAQGVAEIEAQGLTPYALSGALNGFDTWFKDQETKAGGWNEVRDQWEAGNALRGIAHTARGILLDSDDPIADLDALIRTPDIDAISPQQIKDTVLGTYLTAIIDRVDADPEYNAIHANEDIQNIPGFWLTDNSDDLLITAHQQLTSQQIKKEELYANQLRNAYVNSVTSALASTKDIPQAQRQDWLVGRLRALTGEIAKSEDVNARGVLSASANLLDAANRQLNLPPEVTAASVADFVGKQQLAILSGQELDETSLVAAMLDANASPFSDAGLAAMDELRQYQQSYARVRTVDIQANANAAVADATTEFLSGFEPGSKGGQTRTTTTETKPAESTTSEGELAATITEAATTTEAVETHSPNYSFAYDRRVTNVIDQAATAATYAFWQSLTTQYMPHGDEAIDDETQLKYLEKAEATAHFAYKAVANDPGVFTYPKGYQVVIDGVLYEYKGEGDITDENNWINKGDLEEDERSANAPPGSRPLKLPKGVG